MLEESVTVVGEIPSDLPHPRRARLIRDSSDVHPSRPDVDDEEDVAAAYPGHDGAKLMKRRTANGFGPLSKSAMLLVGPPNALLANLFAQCWTYSHTTAAR